MLEQRLETVESRMGEIDARVSAGSSGEKLQAMAGSLLGLVRDKNAAMETAMAGLDQLRARMRTLEQMGSAAEARGLFESLVAQLDAARAAETALVARIARLEEIEPGAAMADQFSRLIEHKDASLAAVLARLGPLEQRLGGFERDLAQLDPGAALDRFAERLDSLRGALEPRLAALEAPRDNPFAEITEQLTRLYAQKERSAETVLVRLGPLEMRLGALEQGLAVADPQAALARFAEQLEAVQAQVAELAVADGPAFAELSEQLTQLQVQKDAAIETVRVRLAPLEERLGAIEVGFADQDEPQASLDAMAERLELLQARIGELEMPGEDPLAGLEAEVARLRAERDTTMEAVFGRLAPLENRLAQVAAGLATTAPRLAALEAADPRTELAGVKERIAALQAAQGTVGERLAALQSIVSDARPFAEISEQLAELHAQKDAAVDAVASRLAPLEARLIEIEARPVPAGPDEAKAHAEEIATQMIALRAAAAQTELFADRLALVETTLPRLSAAQALMLKALDRQGVQVPVPPAAADPAALPQVVPLHHG